MALAGGGTKSIGTRPIAAERVSLSVNALLVDVSGGVLLGVTDRILRLAEGQVTPLTRVPPFFEPFAADGETSRVSRYEPAQIAVGLDGRIVIAEDSPAPRVRVFDSRTREIETIAGDGTVRFFRRSYDGAPALSVPLGHSLYDISVGPDGSVYVAADERILRIVDGRVFLYAGNGEIAAAREGLARDVPVVASAIAVSSDGTLYFVDVGDESSLSVWRIRNGEVKFVAGGEPGFGPASGTIDQLRFNGLEGLAVAPDGSLLIADPENQVIHRLDLAAGTYRREAGVGFGRNGCRIGDGCPAELSELVSPGLVACSPSEKEFLSDSTLGVVEFESNRNLSHVTATSGARIELGASFEYGRPSLEYSVQVFDIAVDSSGHLYISDNLRKGLLVVRADNAHW
jgi:WD40 repeat protein